ncbi:MAG: WYL domain-containing protein [Caldilineaceae bacterium]|nr:WYL domain-containing protein [Caldilineaceae bacterium]
MSDHTRTALLRSLAILRQLQRSPADRDSLADYVRIVVDPTAYGEMRTKADQQLFANDIKRLRELGVDIYYHTGAYHLVSYGAFSPVGLGDDALNALAFLSESFGPGAPNSNAVQELVRQVADWLPESQRDSLVGRRRRLRMDLRRRDHDQIHPAVQNAIERALSQRRLLQFHYRSPSQADGASRTHTVQPWGLYFDTLRRHLYLDAYCLSVTGPYGFHRQELWRAYRLGRILPDEIKVLPDRLPPERPSRPRIPLEYWLAPEIARQDEITAHFDDTQLHERDAHGWLRVTATTHDLFQATRLLLTYGPYCKVTGGPAARQEMARLVRGMAGLYGVGAAETTED